MIHSQRGPRLIRESASTYPPSSAPRREDRIVATAPDLIAWRARRPYHPTAVRADRRERARCHQLTDAHHLRNGSWIITLSDTPAFGNPLRFSRDYCDVEIRRSKPYVDFAKTKRTVSMGHIGAMETTVAGHPGT